MKLLTIAVYAAMCAIWSTTWYAIKLALVGFPPIAGAGVRFVAAGLVFALVAAFAKRPGGLAPPLRLILVLATCFFGANYALTYYAEARLPSGLVAVLYGTMPFFIFGVAALTLGERLTLRMFAGALLALAGVATISLTGQRGDLLAIGAALLASWLSGYGNVELKRFAASDPLRTLPPAMLLAGTTMTAVGFAVEHIDLHAAFAPGPLLATLYLALAGSALAFYLNHWLLQRIPAGILGLSALIIPVVAVAFGVVVGHERVGPRDLAGASLVVAGMAVALAPLGGQLPPGTVPASGRSTEI
jgi:drug/metabolite transporter (DMT)-like permease